MALAICLQHEVREGSTNIDPDRNHPRPHIPDDFTALPGQDAPRQAPWRVIDLRLKFV
jgi:hypothetical protein